VNRDIIVVGAGIVGCAVAYELARRGASVEIVDARHPVGMGATQASAGVLAPYIEARDGNPLLDLAVRSLDLFDEFLTDVSSSSGVDVPYRRTGTIDVAIDESEMHTLRTTADVLARRGVPARMIDRAGVCDEEPRVAGDVVGALVIFRTGSSRRAI
jgi:glycine oxidase